MVAKLIVSIDCEGRWGIADRAVERLAAITNDNLRHAYRTIITILDRHNASASFGFVAALGLEEESALSAIKRCDGRLRFGANDWLAQAKRDLQASRPSGWSAPDLVDLVVAAGRHYLCSHGGYHIPYSENQVGQDAIAQDIKLIKEFEARHGLDLDILIFPRNVVGFQSQLAEAGFLAYRQIDGRELAKGLRGKMSRLANEFLSADKHDLVGFSYSEGHGMMALSPGKFLNARIGARSLISPATTFRRIDNFLNTAVKNRSLVHFYTHPHNFITDTTMASKLDYLLLRAQEYVNQGLLRIITIGDEFHAAKGP